MGQKGSGVSGWWVSGWVSGRHMPSENIWFVWSKWSYSGVLVGCHLCGRTMNGRNVKIGLKFWVLNS